MAGVPLEHSAGLSPTALDAVADLEHRVLAVDGGRLKLEWNDLRTRPSDQVNDVLWWEGERLLGFSGIYSFGGKDPEITGMVDPSVRRRGIGAGLLDAVSEICRGRAMAQALLVVPHSSRGGRGLALARSGRLDHSEHALLLEGVPTDGPRDPRVRFRAAGVDDVDAVGEILDAAFNAAPADLPGQLARTSRRERTLLIELSGRPVGTVRITHELTAGTDTGGIYGFAVHPDEQGHGIGGDVLRRCCRLLREEGADRVTLEVAVENEHALGLYTNTGFVPVATEDYYALSTR